MRCCFKNSSVVLLQRVFYRGLKYVRALFHKQQQKLKKHARKQFEKVAVRDAPVFFSILLLEYMQGCSYLCPWHKIMIPQGMCGHFIYMGSLDFLQSP